MRMPWTAAAVLLALAGRAAEGIPPVFLDGVWVQHLRARIAAAEGNDRRMERHARDLLRVKPDDAGALLALVETLHRQDKRGLASALVRFAHLAHPADARITGLYDRLKDLRPAGGGAFAPDTQIQTLSASVQETAIRGDADGLRAAEDQLAGMLVRFRPSINHLDALKAAAADPARAIDLVLMDVMMPVMDGLTATRQIRNDPNWAKLPIVMLTAKAMPDDQERCLEAGANDYMAKPIEVDKLLSLVRVWMPR